MGPGHQRQEILLPRRRKHVIQEAEVCAERSPTHQLDCPKPPFIVTRNGVYESSTPAYPFQLSIPGPPFSYVYHLLYAYPALLPLAMARTQAFKEEVAFKFFFCPGGVSLIADWLHSHLSLRKMVSCPMPRGYESTLW
jgi:hypothetical protein